MKPRKVLSIILASSLCFNCSGGGGDNGQQNKDFGQTQNTLTTQNMLAEDFYNTADSILENIRLVEEKVDAQDPSNILDLDFLLADRADLIAVLSDLSWAMAQTEESLRGFNVKESLQDFDTLGVKASVIATIGAVCLGTVAIGALVAGMVNSMEKGDELRRQCYDDYLENVLDGIVTAEEGFVEYKTCVRRARSAEKDGVFFAAGGALFSFYGPNLAATNTGKVALTSVSAVLDVDGINTYFVEHEKRNPSIVGVGQSDVGGELVLPEGEWDMVLYKDGFARLGTEEVTPVTVVAGETVNIELVPVRVQDATLETCSDSDTGGFTILNIVNLNGENIQSPTPAQISAADISISGTPNQLFINWKLSNAVILFVVKAEINFNPEFSYGIIGEEIETNSGFMPRPFSPPVRYGDYDVPGSDPLLGAQVPASEMQSGETYAITLGNEKGDQVLLSFTVN